MAARSYNLKACTLALDGVVISEFGATDAYSVEPAADDYAATVGADGSVTHSRTNNKMERCTLTLAANGIGDRLLGEFYRAQELLPIPARFSFFLIDPVTGTKVVEPRALITRKPTISRGVAVGESQWMIDLPSPQREHSPTTTPS